MIFTSSNASIKALIISIPIAMAGHVIAAPALSEQEVPLSINAKKRLKSALKEILQSKDITTHQYMDSLRSVDKTPCNGIDKHLRTEYKQRLNKVIAKKENYKKVEVLEQFFFKNWHIVYINNYVSDEPYLFYASDPTLGAKSITSWSGAATIFETSEIEQWVLKSASGIPPKLASCFAWHVTLNRD
jgi:hypothetical protein